MKIKKMKIKKILEKYLKKNSKIGVGVSGGPDSMALLKLIQDFYKEKKYPTTNIHVIHCDHNLRIESKQEKETIINFAQKNTVISTIINKNKSQKEHTLREERYQTFATYCKKYQLEYFFLGHNLTDRIESTFMNMLRGCDKEGFLSMQELQDHPLLDIKVLRPLLAYTKQEIQHYCDQKNIPYHIDISNFQENISLRNKIRNIFLPQITKYSNRITKETNSFFESFKKIYTSIQKGTTELIHHHNILPHPEREAEYFHFIYINSEQITSENIYNLFTQYHCSQNISQKRVEEFTKFFKKGNNGYKYVNHHHFFLHDKKIYIIKAPRDFWKKNIDKSILINKLGKYEIDGKILNIQNPEYINHYIGYPKKDMTYKHKGKTRNKYCINKKIPLRERNTIPLIYNISENIYTIKKYFYQKHI